MMFDSDAILPRASSLVDGEPGSNQRNVRLSIMSANKVPTLRFAVGVQCVEQMGWCHGTRLLPCFSREHGIMGLMSPSNARGTVMLRRTTDSANPECSTASYNVMIALSRIADDLRQKVIDYVGEGVIVAPDAITQTADAIYWTMIKGRSPTPTN